MRVNSINVYYVVRVMCVIILLCFFIWILPLGAFIRVTDEQEVCGGQRAICLCSHHLAKNKSSSHGKVVIVNPGGVNKEAGSAGGPGHDFLLENRKDIANSSISNYFEKIPNLYNLLISKSIDHVPKV